MPIQPLVEDRSEPSTYKIYELLNRISDIPVQEQEEIRKLLKESAGIHILCLDEQKGRLTDILTRNEVEGYISLIKNQSFGLAVIGRTVVAVSPDSPIRPHVGVNPSRLRELEELYEREVNHRSP